MNRLCYNPNEMTVIVDEHHPGPVNELVAQLIEDTKSGRLQWRPCRWTSNLTVAKYGFFGTRYLFNCEYLMFKDQSIRRGCVTELRQLVYQQLEDRQDAAVARAARQALRERKRLVL